MTTPFSPDRSDAIRAALLDEVRASSRAHLARHRWLPAVGMLCLGLVTGAAVSAAALWVTPPTAPPVVTEGGVPAPPGILPGAPIISLLGDISTFAVDATTVIPFPVAPSGATHIRASVTCLTPGFTTWGTNADGNNPGVSCGPNDVGVNPATYVDFSLADSPNLYVGEDRGATSIVTMQFVNYVETVWGVNARGETYGVDKDGAAPDLIAAYGTNEAGEQVFGYARGADLQGSGPDHPGMPSSPEQALEWQRENELRYPNGWDIPLYEFDGVTEIGVMHVGG